MPRKTKVSVETPAVSTEVEAVVASTGSDSDDAVASPEPEPEDAPDVPAVQAETVTLKVLKPLAKYPGASRKYQPGLHIFRADDPLLADASLPALIEGGYITDDLSEE